MLGGGRLYGRRNAQLSWRPEVKLVPAAFGGGVAWDARDVAFKTTGHWRLSPCIHKESTRFPTLRCLLGKLEAFEALHPWA